MENNNNFYNPATDKQIAYLKKLGYQGNTDGLTSGECSQLIMEYSGKGTTQASGTQATTPKQEPSNAVVESHSSALQVAEKNISDKVFNQINVLQNEQGLVLPNNYNVSNALKSAYLVLAGSGLLNTDQTALAQALLDMCIQGLTPAKKQCYFINYGGKVNMMRSYFGDRSVCINAGIVDDIQANIIYQDDVVNVNYVNDRMTVEHKTNWANFEKPIVGAYAWAVLPDGTKIYDIMTINRIKKSWAMSKNNTNNKLHSIFDDDACKRTVIRHMAKNLFNSSGDNEVITRSYNETTENEYDNKREFQNATIEEVKDEQEQVNASQEFKVDDEIEVNNDGNFNEFIDRK